MPRQSKPEEVVMAGDGGRVPDVSEQRAEAVARALLPEGVGSWDEQSDLQRSYLLRQARVAVDVIDRDVHGLGGTVAVEALREAATVLHAIHVGGQRNGKGMADCSRSDCRERATILAVASPDPASVLAALLAESPEATVAAIEALLTSDEAVEGAADALATRLVDPTFGPTHFQLKMRERDRAQVATSAACRSLLSKAPKGDG